MIQPLIRVTRGPLVVDDVHSRLNATRVARLECPRDLGELRGVVQRAAREGAGLAIAGRRHAMGGQQFARDGVLLDTAELSRVLALDSERGLFEVEAGITWPELVAGSLALQEGHPRQWGIAQKQTGADRLSVGGALAANGHGRGLAMKPLVGDVVSFVLVDAAGEVRRCSRDENPELFRLVIGGYGLFGVIYSVTLRLRPRCKLRRAVELIDVEDLGAGFERRAAEGALYGDFQFAIDERSPEFLRRGVFSCYRPVPDATPIPEDQRTLCAEDWLGLLHLAHTDKSEAFRRYAAHYCATDGQVYWSDTHQLGVYVDGYHRELDTRMGCAHPASEVITEVYVPPAALPDFLSEVRADLRRHGVNLIYGTIRRILRDDETFLAWARGDYACVIFNLHTEHTPAGLQHSAAAFRRLIDMAARRGGSFFLTYHRHATREQVAACYPQFEEFLRQKQARDPEGVFQSDWYRHYRALFQGCARGRAGGRRGVA